MEPEIITEKEDMRTWSRIMKRSGRLIGLVPTMGYLHHGHISLITEAKKHADVIVVSIYVNPGQFSPSEDLSTYPSDFSGDLEKLRNMAGGVDVVFHPHDLYCHENVKIVNPSSGHENGDQEMVSSLEKKGAGHETWIRVERLEKVLCGKSRPVFFRGVSTIVAKLFNIVEPDVAVFGKKDYQQWRIIERLVIDLDFPIKVIGSEIVRDPDGLASSSRNVHLSVEERHKALFISTSLYGAKMVAEKGNVSSRELRDMVIRGIHDAGGIVDYAEIIDMQSLEALEDIRGSAVFCVAAWFGKVRLIDNLEIHAI